MGKLLDILTGAGNLADLPGSMVRDILGGQNPLDQLLSPFSAQNRLTGRDLNRRWGLAGEQDTGLNAAGGMATELATDPLSWIGAGALFKALRGAGKAASAAGTAGRAVQRTGLQQALSRAAAPATAYSVASPVAGAYLMGDNPEGAAWKNYVGMGLMAAPLVLGMAKGAKGLVGKLKGAQEAVQAPRQGPYYSRLQEALMNAPEKFETRPEAVRVTPAKTITHPQTGAVIKEIPEQRHVTPGATAYEQLSSYLKDRAHPQEVDWVLGQQFADQPSITRQALIDAYEKGKINLETVRHGGGEKLLGYQGGARNAGRQVFAAYPIEPVPKPLAQDRAVQEATRRTQMGGEFTPVVKPVREAQFGPLVFGTKNWWIPGGKNRMETPIRLGGGHQPLTRETITDDQIREWARGRIGDTAGNPPTDKQVEAVVGLARSSPHTLDSAIKDINRSKPGVRFRDPKDHYGDDVLAWVNTDQRTLPDGSKMRFVQEMQSDWHQMGAKQGYVPTEKMKADALAEMKSVRRQQQAVYEDVVAHKPGAADKFNELERRASELGWVLSEHSKTVPNAPFRGNEWVKLTIKQAIADAIEAGDDVVGFASPELVSRTQGMPIEKARKLYGEIVPNLVNEMLKPYGVKLEKVNLPRYATALHETTHSPHRIVLEQGGKRLAVTQPTKEGRWLVMEEGRQIGDSSSTKDDAIEYAKRILASRDPTNIIAFRIPDAMKKTAKTKGFPLMSVAPFAAAAGTGALARILQDRRQEPQA